MAEDKKYYHNIDLDKNKVKNILLNPLSTSERTALSLSTTDKGYVVFDTNLNSQYFWNGTQWIQSSGSTPTLQSVLNVGNGASNYGGIGNASIQLTNFTNNRTLYINDNNYPTIKIVDNLNSSHTLSIDLDTITLNGTSYNWSSIVSPSTPTLQQVTNIGNIITNSITASSFITSGGTSAQYVAGDGSLITFPTIPSLTGYVPYTGATSNLNLGSYGITTNTITLPGTTSQYVRGDGSLATFTTYSLPIASSSILGGVKIGSGVSIALDGTISVSTNYQAPLNGTGFVKISGTTISYDNSTYLTSNQTITLSGDISGTGSTSITTSLSTITQSSSGSFVKITLDTKGRVVGNTPVIASDLTSLLSSSYFPLLGGSITGTGGNGFVGYISQSATPSTPSSGFRLYADNTDRFSWIGTNGYIRTFDGVANTANRVYTLPNRDITFDNITTSSTTNGTGFLKGDGSNISFDNSTYLTSVGISNLTATGTPNSTTYLRGDNTWAAISGVLSGLTSGQVTFANSSSSIIGDTGLTWNNTNKTLTVTTNQGLNGLNVTALTTATTSTNSLVSISSTITSGAGSNVLFVNRQGGVGGPSTTADFPVRCISIFKAGTQELCFHQTNGMGLQVTTDNYTGLNSLYLNSFGGDVYAGSSSNSSGSTLFVYGKNSVYSSNSFRVLNNSNIQLFNIDSGGNISIGGNTTSSLFQIFQRTTGVGTVSTSGTTVTGTNTQFTNTFKIGDTITIASIAYTISAIASDTSMTTNTLATLSNQTYTLTGGARFNVYGNGNVSWGTPGTGGTSSTMWYDARYGALNIGSSTSQSSYLLNVNGASYFVGTTLFGSSTNNTGAKVTINGGSTSSGFPSTSGSTFTNGILRLTDNQYANALDFGFGTSTNNPPWLQARYNNASTTVPLILQPNGGGVLIGGQTTPGSTITLTVASREVGQSTADVILAIDQTNAIYNSLLNFSYRGTAYGRIQFNNTSNDFTIGSLSGATGGKTYLSNNGTNILSIYSGGKVGIQNGGTFTDDTVNILQVTGRTKLNGQVSYGGSTPTIAAGTGAGTSPTASIVGTNNGGVITVTTGTLPSSSATLVTVTYTGAFATGSQIILYPTNSATALLSGVSMVFTTGTTTTFTITTGTTALTAATTYSWAYVVTGY